MSATPLADLLRAAGKNWHIEQAAGVWVAAKISDDGKHRHFLVARDTKTLTSKILRADEKEARQQ
jgi:hypothetical protein